MDEFVFKHRKAILVVGILVAVAIIGVSIWNIIWNNINSATISVMVTPSIAKVKIDGREYESMKEYRIQPGTYSVEVSAEGFVSKTEEFVVPENEVTNVFMYLLPTEENKDWYNEHPDDALILGELQNDETTDKLAELRKEYPILKELPLEIDYFTAGYANRVRYTISYLLNEDNTGFKITITDYTGGNRQNALDKLTARGVKLEDFVIEYTDKSTDSEWGSAR